MTLRRFLILGLAAAAVGCQDVASPGSPITDPTASGIVIRSDSAVYQLRHVPGIYEATAIVTIANATGDRIYFPRCQPDDSLPMYGIRRSGAGSSGRSALGLPWACVGGAGSGSIAPRTMISVPVSLASGESPNSNPPITPDQRVGTFRVDFVLCRSPGTATECDQLPRALRQSNEFAVRF